MYTRLHGLKFFFPSERSLFLLNDKYSKRFELKSIHDNKTLYSSKEIVSFKKNIKKWRDAESVALIRNYYSIEDKLLVSELLASGYHRYFSILIIPSLSNPRWMIPIENFNIARSSKFIKPTKLKSRIVFSLASFLYTIRQTFIKFIFPFELLVMKSDNAIKQKCQPKINGVNNQGKLFDSFSLYTGATGPYQKFTCQLLNNNKICSYAKISSHPLTISRLENEYNILKILDTFTFSSLEVPKPISMSKTFDSTIIVQSANKSSSFMFYKYLNEYHIKALAELFLKTMRIISKHELIEQIEHSIEFLMRRSDVIKNLIQKALSKIDSLYPFDNILIGLSNGDFSPWNVFGQEKNVYVFDWELGDYRVPTWDIYNFIFHSHYNFDNLSATKMLALLTGRDSRYSGLIKMYTEIIELKDGNYEYFQLLIFLSQLLIFYSNYEFQESLHNYNKNVHINKINAQIIFIINSILNEIKK